MAKVSIKRFNPSSDEKPYFQTYDVNVEEGMTLLELLGEIKDKQDPSLTFRAFCRSAICGSCAMRVNGVAQLACKVQAEDKIKNGTVTIEPLANFEVIKDLVVDQESALSKLKSIKPWLEPDEKVVPKTLKSESIVTPTEFKKYDSMTDCILCMACYGSCNANEANDEYVGPFQLTKMLRFIEDSRDGIPISERLETAKENGFWDCVQCQMCLQACPKGIKPAEDIQELRRISTNLGDESVGAKRAQTWLKDVFRTGQIDKFNLPVNAYGQPGEAAREKLAKEFSERGIPEERYAPNPFDGIANLQQMIMDVEEKL